jgi:CRP-like cAMP-binding protein
VYETVRAGGIVGEMAIVNKGARRSASVIAGTRAELLKIDTPTFLSLVASKPDFALEVMRVMAHRLRSWTAVTDTITTELQPNNRLCSDGKRGCCGSTTTAILSNLVATASSCPVTVL